jgi:hypothetical protein
MKRGQTYPHPHVENKSHFEFQITEKKVIKTEKEYRNEERAISDWPPHVDAISAGK